MQNTPFGQAYEPDRLLEAVSSITIRRDRLQVIIDFGKDSMENSAILFGLAELSISDIKMCWVFATAKMPNLKESSDYFSCEPGCSSTNSVQRFQDRTGEAIAPFRLTMSQFLPVPGATKVLSLSLPTSSRIPRVSFCLHCVSALNHSWSDGPAKKASRCRQVHFVDRPKLKAQVSDRTHRRFPAAPCAQNAGPAYPEESKKDLRVDRIRDWSTFH
jgi:hypothetical protein